jgi:two-component system sensor histidine kinase PhoQ
VSPTPRRPASLRLRAALFAVATLAIALGLVGLALDSSYRRSAESDLRQRMETWVYLALAATEVGADGRLQVDGDLGDPLLGQPASGVYLHVHSQQDHWDSPSALGLQLPELAPVAPATATFATPSQGSPFYTLQFGVAWELDEGDLLPFTVSVLVDPQRLEPGIAAFRAGLARSLGAAGLILAIAQWLFFSLSLRPLRLVANDVARIESGAADRLDGPYPRELEPLTDTLDRLLQTEKANQARYRSALDSLAHSLKTPLAVLRAGLHESSPADRDTLRGAVDDMRRLVATRLERAAASTRRTLGAPVSVQAVAERLLASLRKVHSQVLRQVEVSIEPGLVFYGEERDLLEMLGNLLDNACKYGAGKVQVSAGVLEPQRARPGLWLEVANDGAAVPATELERLLQRGVRGDERVEGHGLGLSIVSEVVSAYGGTLQFGGGALGGVAVRIELPPA